MFFDAWESKWEYFPQIATEPLDTRTSAYAHVCNMTMLATALKTGIQLRYGDDVKIAKNGSNPKGMFGRSVTWKYVQGKFAKGYSFVINNVEKFDPSVHLLCAGMERELHARVDANAYATPPESQAFPPHYDMTDTLIIQVEGRKSWHLCERLNFDQLSLRGTGQATVIAEDKISKTSCTELVLEIDDMLYIPAGTVHFAKTHDRWHSLHVTITILRWETTWATFIANIADPHIDDNTPRPNALAVSKAAAAQPFNFDKQLPHLAEFELSVDDKDLPIGFLDTWAKYALRLIESLTSAKLRKHLLKQLESNTAWSFALRELRTYLVQEFKSLSQDCQRFGLEKVDSKGTHFRRHPGSRVALMHGPQNQFVMGFAGDREELVSDTWAKGLRFALGSFDANTSKGKPFKLDNVKRFAKSNREAKDLLKLLMKECIIELVTQANAMENRTPRVDSLYHPEQNDVSLLEEL